MTQSKCSKLYFLLSVFVASITCSLHAQISVGGAGTGILTFDTLPAVTEWSQVSVAGGGADIHTTAQVDAAVQLRTAAGVNTVMRSSGTVPPSANAAGTWNSAAFYLQSRPTGNNYTILMATLRNDIGSDASDFTITFDLNMFNAAALELPGFRTYYSFSGEAGTWAFIPELSDTNTPGTYSAKVMPPSNWPAGSLMYLLFVDDNADTAQDESYTIDNFSVTATPGILTCLAITNQTSSITVPERGGASFSIMATGSPQFVQWYRGGVAIPGATQPTYTINSVQFPSDNGAQFRAIVTNSLCAATSTVVTLTVQQDLTPPTVIRAVADTDPSKVNLTFSEPMDAATLGESSFILYETGTDPFASPYISLTTVLTDGTNLVVNTDPRLPDVNYSILLLDVRDASSGNNLINPNPTEVKLLTTIELVGFTNNNVWKWTAETNLFGTGWETVGYDDSNPAVWPEGPAGLGNDGDNVLPLLTPTAYAVNSAPQFFRRHFNFPGLTSGAELRMRYSFEDGAVVYINGQEAGRFNVNPGPLDVTTRTPAGAANPLPISGPVLLPLTNVVPGDNVIAVVVIQTGATSSDIFMALELTAIIRDPITGPVKIVSAPQPQTVNEGQNATFNVIAEGGLPISYQWRKGGVDLPGKTNASLLISAATPGDVGDYSVFVSNSGGSTNSPAVHLTVTSDATAPTIVSAIGDTNLNVVTVTLNDALPGTGINFATAQDPARYQIRLTAGGGLLTVTSATATNVGNNTVVTLTTATPRTQGQDYTVVLNNVTDRAATPNAVSPNTAAIRATVALLAFDNVWRYDQSGTDLGTAWKESAYNDSAWPSGRGVLGFETTSNTLVFLRSIAPPDGTNTVLSLTNNTGAGIDGTNITFYFRTTVNVPLNPAGATVQMRAYIDDGAIIYVNGIEQMRFNMTNGPGYTNLANAALGEPSPAASATFVVSNLTGLVSGANVIAVEVHQDSRASSDVDFGMQLDALVTSFSGPVTGPRLNISRNLTTGQVTISWSGAGILQQASAIPTGGPAAWSDVPGNPNPYVFTPTPGQNRFFSLRQ